LRRYVQEGSYGGKISGYAYWPPGLSLFLAPLIAIAGPQPWVTVLGNLILSCLMVFLTYRLAQASAGETAGKMASFLIAVWPNHIMSVGLASKEQLLLALMTGILLLVLRSTLAQSNRSVAQYAFGAGLLLGAATLTQPAFMLFPSLLVLLDLLRAVNLKILFLRLFCLYAGMILVVAPWTLRNYEVFGKFIPVSTNGGDVFYRSNNPLATGGYIDRGEVDLSQLGELEANQMGYKLGKEWILANPGQFLKLAIKKQMLFLGDDAVGAYESLKRALGKEGITYIFFKGLSNAYWLLIWMLIFLGWITHRQLYYTPGVMLLVLSVLYLLAIDSVFESGARHHVPLSAALAVLAALPFSRIPDKIGTQ